MTQTTILLIIPRVKGVFVPQSLKSVCKYVGIWIYKSPAV